MIEEINSRNISVLLISDENRISFTALPPSFPIQLPYLIQETFSWRDGQRCSHHSFLPLISRVRGNSGERRTINHFSRNLCARRRLSTNGVGEIYYLEESWACIADIHKISGEAKKRTRYEKSYLLWNFVTCPGVFSKILTFAVFGFNPLVNPLVLVIHVFTINDRFLNIYGKLEGKKTHKMCAIFKHIWNI